MLEKDILALLRPCPACPADPGQYHPGQTPSCPSPRARPPPHTSSIGHHQDLDTDGGTNTSPPGGGHTWWQRPWSTEDPSPHTGHAFMPAPQHLSGWAWLCRVMSGETGKWAEAQHCRQRGVSARTPIPSCSHQSVRSTRSLHPMRRPVQRQKPSRSLSPWSTRKLAFTKENQEKLKTGCRRASMHPRSQHRS